jgi:hypothetical protein
MSGPRTAQWSTPDDIVASVKKLWESGALLTARLDGESLFPHELRLRQPGAADMGEQFDAVRNWISALSASSRDRKGYGYELVWRDINHRQLGRNRLPAAAVIPAEADALRMLGRGSDARRFDQLAGATLAAFPALRPWIHTHALVLLEQGDAWLQMLAVLDWFVRHPRPGIYLRQLDIGGVDSKFIDARKGLFAELLDYVMPAETILASHVGLRQFEGRYGLLSKPPMMRFRLLDAAHFIGGLSDLTVPVAQFAALQSRVERVFVTENDINALAFPDVRSSMVVFGGGYGIDRLAQVDWLRGRELLYWGDIDTHGFAILDRLRANLPHARSILMDADTLHGHRHLWGAEEVDKRYTGQLTRLTPAEQQLFMALRDDQFGPRLRLEQERVGYSWAVEAIRACANG